MSCIKHHLSPLILGNLDRWPAASLSAQEAAVAAAANAAAVGQVRRDLNCDSLP